MRAVRLAQSAHAAACFTPVRMLYERARTAVDCVYSWLDVTYADFDLGNRVPSPSNPWPWVML